MQDIRLKCQLSSSKQEREVFHLRHQLQVVFSPRIPINSSSLTLLFPVVIYLLQFLLFVQNGLHTLWVSEGLIISRLHAGLEFSLLFPSTLSTLSLCFSYQTFILIKNFFSIFLTVRTKLASTDVQKSLLEFIIWKENYSQHIDLKAILDFPYGLQSSCPY